MSRHLRSLLLTTTAALTLLAGVQVAGAGAQVTTGVTTPKASDTTTTKVAPTTTAPAPSVPPTTVAPTTTTPAGDTKPVLVPPTTVLAGPPPVIGATTTTNPGALAVADPPKLNDPQVDRILRSMERSGASSTAALIEALKPLQGVGMTVQEALALGMGRFPLQGLANWTDDWLDPRAGPPEHQHMGTDLFAAFDVPVRAPADGTVRFEDAGLGGKAAYVTTTDGTYYYMAHLNRFAAGLSSGATVKQGQVVAFNGDSGNARGGTAHVHFEVHPGGGGAVNPKPMLDAWVAEALARAPELVAAFQPQAAASDDGVPQILVATGLTRRFSVPSAPTPASGLGDFDRAVLGSPLLDPAVPEK